MSSSEAILLCRLAERCLAFESQSIQDWGKHLHRSQSLQKIYHIYVKTLWNRYSNKFSPPLQYKKNISVLSTYEVWKYACKKESSSFLSSVYPQPIWPKQSLPYSEIQASEFPCLILRTPSHVEVLNPQDPSLRIRKVLKKLFPSITGIHTLHFEENSGPLSAIHQLIEETPLQTLQDCQDFLCLSRMTRHKNALKPVVSYLQTNGQVLPLQKGDIELLPDELPKSILLYQLCDHYYLSHRDSYLFTASNELKQAFQKSQFPDIEKWKAIFALSLKNFHSFAHKDLEREKIISYLTTLLYEMEQMPFRYLIESQLKKYCFLVELLIHFSTQKEDLSILDLLLSSLPHVPMGQLGKKNVSYLGSQLARLYPHYPLVRELISEKISQWFLSSHDKLSSFLLAFLPQCKDLFLEKLPLPGPYIIDEFWLPRVNLLLEGGKNSLQSLHISLEGLLQKIDQEDLKDLKQTIHSLFTKKLETLSQLKSMTLYGEQPAQDLQLLCALKKSIPWSIILKPRQKTQIVNLGESSLGKVRTLSIHRGNIFWEGHHHLDHLETIYFRKSFFSETHHPCPLIALLKKAKHLQFISFDYTTFKTLKKDSIKALQSWEKKSGRRLQVLKE